MIRKYLPYFLNKRLFGDRKQFGTKCDYNDPDYLEWSKNYLKFYVDNQKGSLGEKVCHFGFRIVKGIDFSGKTILELGPGKIEHILYNDSRPDKYILVDIDKQFLESSGEILKESGYNSIEKIAIPTDNTKLPLDDNSVDVILTFHQLEHVYNLENYILDLKRVLKPGGYLVGAVPTEGGIAWGLGRFMTSRQYVKRNMSFNYDKIICWEHPNFVDNISSILDKHFIRKEFKKKPFASLPYDFNLSLSFVYVNNKEIFNTNLL